MTPITTSFKVVELVMVIVAIVSVMPPIMPMAGSYCSEIPGATDLYTIRVKSIDNPIYKPLRNWRVILIFFTIH